MTGLRSGGWPAGCCAGPWAGRIVQAHRRSSYCPSQPGEVGTPFGYCCTAEVRRSTDRTEAGASGTIYPALLGTGLLIELSHTHTPPNANSTPLENRLSGLDLNKALLLFSTPVTWAGPSSLEASFIPSPCLPPWVAPVLTELPAHGGRRQMHIV